MSDWDWRGRGKEGLPTLATQLGKASDETRQQYATYQVQQCQRFAKEPLTFDFLLWVFRGAGEMYDQGERLRDYKNEWAA